MRAICGCVSRPRMRPSREKRASPDRPTSAAFSSLTATRPFEAAVGAFRQPHAAHPAVADRLDQPVGAELQPAQGRPGRLDGGGAFEEVVVLDRVALGEPAGDLVRQLG